MKLAFKIMSGLMLMFFTAPIWYYLLHSILVAINADRLLWFLYWVYVPASLFASVLSVIADKLADKK